MSNNPLKIRQVHHIELYVGNAKQADYFYRNAFGFDRIAYTGLETGNREQCSYALQQGTFRLLLTTPYTPLDKASAHILKHGDGVRDVALEVDDADYAFEVAVSRGAEPAVAPYTIRGRRAKRGGRRSRFTATRFIRSSRSAVTKGRLCLTSLSHARRDAMRVCCGSIISSPMLNTARWGTGKTGTSASLASNAI